VKSPPEIPAFRHPGRQDARSARRDRIIYESRPDVTADAAALCLKSGNAAILRGGSEAIHANQAIAACVHAGLKSAGLPETAVQVIATAIVLRWANSSR